MKKQILSILLSVLMVLTMVSQTLIFSSAADIKSGSCGEKLTYTLDDTGTLTISGTGNMTDYDWTTRAPWDSSKESIKTVVIKNGVTSIGNSAFYGCTALTDITVPGSVKSIGNSAFSECAALTGINIPDGVTSIGDYAFYGCTALTDIIIPDGVTDLSYGMFIFCTSLKSITIPASVTFIDGAAFDNCTALTGITVDADNKEYISCDGVLFSKDKTVLIEYPQGITDTEYTVPDGVIYFDFTGCSNITDITIPKSVTNISYGAFYNCSSLASVTLPDSIMSIGKMAFSECNSLSDIYYEGSEAQWGNIDIGYANEPLFNANIYFDFNEHQHSFGEWVITAKPTYSETGKKERKCKVCNKRDTAVIPVLKANTVINAQNADVSLKYDNKVLKEKVKLHVNEEYSGGAFEIINNRKGFFSNKVFDITLTGANGKVQPDGFVLVGISLPENFTEENTFVYYVSEKDNSITKMNSYVKNGIIWFETDHFSAYAIVDETKRLDGDMDGDGKLTAGDARTVLRASVRLEELSSAQKAAADVDKDKAITAADARIVLRRSVGLPD